MDLQDLDYPLNVKTKLVLPTYSNVTEPVLDVSVSVAPTTAVILFVTPLDAIILHLYPMFLLLFH